MNNYIPVIITSIIAPVILLLLNRLFNKKDKADNLSSKLDNLEVKVDNLADLNKLQNERLDSLEFTITRINNNLQFEDKVIRKFLEMQTNVNHSVMISIKDGVHNGDILKSNEAIDTMKDLLSNVDLGFNKENNNGKNIISK